MTEVYIASAFCKDGKGGNKAGVVLSRPDLTVAEKQRIAAELGFSETVFVHREDDTHFVLEYFTPTDEVPLCGHATVAAFFTLNHLGLLDRRDCTIRTGAGELAVSLEEDGMVLMEQTLPRYYDQLPSDLFDGCFARQAILSSLPIQIVSTGLKDILLPISSPDELEQLSPDFPAIEEVSRQQDVVGIHAFALSPEPGVTALCRNFAPLYGIDEESATGTSNCALACYLFRYHHQQDFYVFDQGHSLGAPSRITARIVHHDGVIDRVFVGGYGSLEEKRLLPI